MAEEKKTKAGEIVPVTPGQIVEATTGSALPAHLQNLDDVAGLGNSQDANDSSLPFLGIIQSGSPQLKEEESKFIEGAKAGFIFNTATRRFWEARSSKGEDGVLVIPCGYMKNFVEWKPNRGGYAATHEFDVNAIKAMGAKKTKVIIEGKEREQITLPSGNILTETAYTFLLVDSMPMVLGAASSALGPMRDWMSYRRSLRNSAGTQYPSFAKRYRLTTAIQTRDNNTWHNWVFKDVGWVENANEYNLAKDFAMAVERGEVVIGRPDMFDEDTSSNDSGKSRGTEDDGIDV